MTKLTFYNTATRTRETFVPHEPGRVTLYTCGPTVYDHLHVGNWASYIRWDILVRVLRINGYAVTRTMNITDVGHLVSDADDGQDKLEKAARQNRDTGTDGRTTAWDLARFYTDDFMLGMDALGNLPADTYAKATDYIDHQLSLLRRLKDMGYTYVISDGIYFDTAKFPTYADFARLDLADQKAGARVTFNPEKRNGSDFALWKFTSPGETRDMQWETPPDLLDAPATGSVQGFPGWHLECSAIAINTLGETLDIHTGGIDHIPVHHTNEIAQSEAATGVRFANTWLHANFLTVDGTKISKSLGNGYNLKDLEAKGFTPLDLRMLVLQSHYRTEANFTFEALGSAKARLGHWKRIASLRWQVKDAAGMDETAAAKDGALPSLAIIRALIEAVNDDLDTPGVLRIVDEMIGTVEAAPLTELSASHLTDVFEAVDALLGLSILKSTPDISDEQKSRILSRERARDARDYAESDRIRDMLARDGIGLNDVPSDTVWYRV